MDSKLRKLAIMGSLVMILLVSFLVLWDNRERAARPDSGTRE